MKNLLTFLVLLGSWSTLADLKTEPPAPPMIPVAEAPPRPVEFEVTDGTASFRLEHPLKIIQGKAKDITGRITISPNDLQAGSKMEILLATESFRSALPAMQKGTLRALQSSRFQFIQFNGELDVKSFKQALAPNFSGDFVGKLDINGHANEKRIPFDCDFFQNKNLTCRFRHELNLADFWISPPTFLRVRGNSKVETQGQIRFARKKELK